MLRLTLERLPAGPGGEREKIGHIDISNVSEMNGIASYHVYGDKLKLGRAHSAMLLGHRKSDGPWELAAKALRVLGFGY